MIEPLIYLSWRSLGLRYLHKYVHFSLRMMTEWYPESGNISGLKSKFGVVSSDEIRS